MKRREKPWAVVIEDRCNGLIDRWVASTHRTKRKALRAQNQIHGYQLKGSSGSSWVIDQRVETFEPVGHYDPTVYRWTCEDCGGKGYRDYFGGSERHQGDCPNSPSNRLERVEWV